MTIDTSIKNNVKAEDMCITEQTNNDILMLTQFYKREENQVLFNLYQTICQETARQQAKQPTPVYLSYSELCKLFNARYASSKKRNKPKGGDKINT